MPVSQAQFGLNLQFNRKKEYLDKKDGADYLIGYWFCLIEASLCGARPDADTRLTVFDSIALNSDCLSVIPGQA